MDALFDNWKLRHEQSKNISTTTTTEPSDANKINKNDKNTLRTILLQNHKHQKREMGEDFIMRQREEMGTELLDSIAPFTTDKSKLNDNLEEERKTFLIQKRFKSGQT